MNIFSTLYEKLFVGQVERDLLAAYRAGEFSLLDSNIIYNRDHEVYNHCHIVLYNPTIDKCIKLYKDGTFTLIDSKYHHADGKFFSSEGTLSRLFNVVVSDINAEEDRSRAEYKLQKRREAEQFLEGLVPKHPKEDSSNQG